MEDIEIIYTGKNIKKTLLTHKAIYSRKAVLDFLKEIEEEMLK